MSGLVYCFKDLPKLEPRTSEEARYKRGSHLN